MLARLTITVWLAWMGLLGWAASLVVRQVWDPDNRPIVVGLALMLLAGLGLVGVAAWRIFRGDDRRSAIAWLLIGVAPFWFLLGHSLRTYRVEFGRDQDHFDLAARLLTPLVGSVVDLETRFRYRQTTEGERVVMVSAPLIQAREQVAAMDRQIKRMEARLARSVATTPVRWVRGPLLGQSPRSIFHLAIGTRPSQSEAGPDELSSVDRRVVARSMITSLTAITTNPPPLLVEGWAEANSGVDPTELAFLAGKHGDQGHPTTLRDLVSGGRASSSPGFLAVQGGALVNFLLKEYGPARFLDLYATSHSATFDLDCRRTLGVTLDELDEAYRANLGQVAPQSVPASGHWLASLKVGPAVDAVAWRAFLDQDLPKADRLLAPHDQIEMKTVLIDSSAGIRGEPGNPTRRLDFKRSGKLRSLKIQSKQGEEAYLARPDHSVEAHRANLDSPWLVIEDPKLSPQQAYRKLSDRIDDLTRPDTLRINMGVALVGMPRGLEGQGYLEDLAVVGFDRFVENELPYAKVRLESQPLSEGSRRRTFSFVLSAADDFAVRSFRSEEAGGATIGGELAYERVEGVPMFRSLDISGSSPDGTHKQGSLLVVSRRLGPLPEADFTPDRFLNGSTNVEAKDLKPIDDPADAILRASWVALVLGVLCLTGGSAIRGWPSRGEIEKMREFSEKPD